MRKHTKEDEVYLRDNIKYDSETGYLWWTKPSRTRKLNKPIGGPHTEGYLRFSLKLPSGKRYSILTHRFCWFLYYGQWPKEMLDHINGIKTDNRIENLRLATDEENNRNRRSTKSSSSKYKGVSWHKRVKKWISKITLNCRAKHLGYYSSEKEAALAYDKAAREHFRDYACLNFPDEHEQGALNGHDV